MEFIRIGSDRLKICVAPRDMEKYGLDISGLDYDTTASRRVLWSILDDARAETGFDAASGKICVQAYPSSDGGCELFVTILSSARQNCVELKPVRRAAESAYGFSEIDGLTAACSALAVSGYEGCSSAYLCEYGKQRYFLFVYGETGFLCEYGLKIASDVAAAYILEHGVVLCAGDAVHTLAPLDVR